MFRITGKDILAMFPWYLWLGLVLLLLALVLLLVLTALDWKLRDVQWLDRVRAWGTLALGVVGFALIALGLGPDERQQLPPMERPIAAADFAVWIEEHRLDLVPQRWCCGACLVLYWSTCSACCLWCRQKLPGRLGLLQAAWRHFRRQKSGGQDDVRTVVPEAPH